MRVSKVLGSVVAALSAIVAVSATTESRADEPDPKTLVNVACSSGELTATAKAGWHTNDAAPWKWDKGKKVKVDGSEAKFSNADKKCEGTLTAFICNNDKSKCLGPISIPVK